MNTFQRIYNILYQLKFGLTRDGHHISTFKDDSTPANVKTLVADLNQICRDIVDSAKSSSDGCSVFSGWRDFGCQFGDWLQLEHPYDSDWIYGLLETSGVLEFAVRETAKDLVWQAKARPIDPVLQAILDNTDPELKADVMARAGLSIPPPQKLSEKFPRAFGISTFGACHMSYSPLSKEIFIPTDHDTRYGGIFKYQLAPSRSRDVLDLMHSVYEAAVAHDNQHEQEKGLLFIFESKLKEIEGVNKECLAKLDAACSQDGEILKNEIIGYIGETDCVINDAKLFLSNIRDFLQKKSDLEEWFWQKVGAPKHKQQGQVLESLEAAELSMRIKALEKAKGIDCYKSIRSQVLEKQDRLSLSLRRSSSAIQTIIERLPPESFFRRIGSAIVEVFRNFINWLHSFRSAASTMETAMETAESTQNSTGNIRMMPYTRKRRASLVSARDALKEADGLLVARKRRCIVPQAEQVEAVQIKVAQAEAEAKMAIKYIAQAG